MLPRVLLEMRRASKHSDEGILGSSMVEDACAHDQAGQCDAICNLARSVGILETSEELSLTFLIVGPALPKEGVAIHWPQ